MKLDALDHPKTLDFAARLNVELPTAIGHLELLWAFVAKKSPQGDVGKWPDGAIARACYFNGDPVLFIAALTDSGFVDFSHAHRYVIHDWKDHAPRWVASKLSRAKLEFCDCTSDYTGDCSADSTADTVRQGKARQGMGKEKTCAAAHNTPDGLDPVAWQEWIDYRVKIRKPLKPASIQAAQQSLAAFGCDQGAVVKQSIANGYQGLFALKNGGGNGKTQQDTRSRAQRHSDKLDEIARASIERERAAGALDGSDIQATASAVWPQVDGGDGRD